ncbi:MAG: YigZ family protein [Spirochaeta sp.]|jgi:uncharacterized YigZ family protein|nr:YigZ family protein [Spirochaeta sp.]
MKQPEKPARFEIEVKRSRFIAEIDACTDRETAEGVIGRKRLDHPDAAHVVYAFSIGDTNNRQFGMSDDGEPKGTAGRPALEVLKGSGVTDCVLTIVRYFGGTKLGTGGLVHAYGDAAKGCFAALTTKEKRDLVTISLTVPYPLHETVRSVLEANGVNICEETFTESVAIAGWADRDRLSAIQKQIYDVSRGTIDIISEDDSM